MHKDLPVINRADLLKNLQSLLPHIEKDILAYSESNAELSEHLQSEYRAAVEAERTAEHFVFLASSANNPGRSGLGFDLCVRAFS
ncbi:hypothetical protein P4118_29440 [Pseudomonas aeruginosa]|nr:hypothetical protein [Pseudomonas aeruginosa]